MAKSDLIIIGAGGLGKEVLFQLREMNKGREQYRILGFADDNPALIGSIVNDLPVLGSTEYVTKSPVELSAAVCVGNPAIRQSIVERIQINPRISFPVILAPDLRCSDYVRFGRGSIICFSTIITVDVKIGEFVLVSNGCTIGHDSVLEDYATLYSSINVSGSVRVGRSAEVGAGTQIIQGRSIGERAVVGAGAVVVKDLPGACTAVGVPAKPIKYRG